MDGSDRRFRQGLVQSGGRIPAAAQAAEPDVWLLFAPIKRARIDFVAEKAAELGASAVWPVITRHTDVARVNTDRLRANASRPPSSASG